MHKWAFRILPLLLGVLLGACNTLKFVPEDRMLLNKTGVRVEDTKDVRPEDLKKYLQQKQNSEIFGFWKLQLHVYDLAGRDSTKWINRTLKKMGEAPEVFDERLAQSSMQYLQRAMHNMGYFQASVDTTMAVKKRKLRLTYHVTAREPYVLRAYNVLLPQGELRRVATGRDCLVKTGELFDANVLDEERTRIATAMRKNGYYYFEKDYLKYEADSSYGNHTVTVQLMLQDYVTEASDSLRDMIFRQFTVERVNFHTDYIPSFAQGQDIRTEEEDGYSFSYADRRLIRNGVLKRVCRIEPGQMYNQEEVERSYAELTALGPVKYADISFERTGETGLTCDIVISRSKLNSVSVEAEGTYSAGDWGVAGGVGYTNRNLFRGAEELNLSGNVSYEWRQTGGTAIEAKAEASLAFTKAPKVSVSYQFQNRPDEFTRTIANAGLSYSLRRYNSRWHHRFSLVDISYVYLPWISDEFRAYFLQSSNMLKYSYEDHFILGWGYGGSYTSFRKAQPLRSYVTFTYNVETAGNLLYGASHLFRAPVSEEDGAYRIFNVRYAQYAKGDLSFTYHQIVNEKHRLVYHAAMGVAVPYGNAASIPFEKRYFAGGANSVRGWQVRSLGPGAYRGTGDRIDYNNQSGDIKLDLNLEYRWRVWSILELAAFTDAGNIWTIRDYESQPYGVFSKDFLTQLAWSYGVGVRLDFSFFVFRVDFGVKLYDPSRIHYDGKMWRTAPNGLGWKDDMTFHFAIGYPF